MQAKKKNAERIRLKFSNRVSRCGIDDKVRQESYAARQQNLKTMEMEALSTVCKSYEDKIAAGEECNSILEDDKFDAILCKAITEEIEIMVVRMFLQRHKANTRAN